MELAKNHARRNAPQRIFPLERAKVCRTLHRYLEIEATKSAAAKRNARLRMAIGLPPYPRRTLDWERYQ
jgi:hypothetical protein